MLWCGLPAMSVTVVASITITMIASMSIKLNNSSKWNKTLDKKKKRKKKLLQHVRRRTTIVVATTTVRTAWSMMHWTIPRRTICLHITHKHIHKTFNDSKQQQLINVIYFQLFHFSANQCKASVQFARIMISQTFFKSKAKNVNTHIFKSKKWKRVTVVVIKRQKRSTCFTHS